ncbi:aromatic-L-amino-acid decarboxylase [Elysia marginata]|uniref:Histidine decarboxylase n=1 Tax=Elysia marginata TaxID=1093978 RepID=A0AAV4J669_9GAST|nr:aromatic-L-amino-acid decarboxylase [Elysia marginata]
MRLLKRTIKVSSYLILSYTSLRQQEHVVLVLAAAAEVLVVVEIVVVVEVVVVVVVIIIIIVVEVKVVVATAAAEVVVLVVVVVVTTASECTFVTLLAARTEAIRRYKLVDPTVEDADINGRLMGYCSDQAHSSVEKAGLIGLVKLRFLSSDENLSLRGDKLQEAITADRKSGYIPFFVCATLGTTGACAFDILTEIGPICESERLWLHIDAAYAGSAFICPEYRKWMDGIEYADSLAFNPSKWLMVHFDCSALWLKDARALHRTFNVEPLYLQHENSVFNLVSHPALADRFEPQVPVSEALVCSESLWRGEASTTHPQGWNIVLPMGVRLATMFEEFVQADPRFEVAAQRHLGMVVFRIAGTNDLTEQLLKRLNKQGKVHMVPASLKGKYVIRFTVTSQFTTEADIKRDWSVITDMARAVLCDADTRVESERIEETPEENEEDEDGDDRVKTESSRAARDGTRPSVHDQVAKDKPVPSPVTKRKPNLHLMTHNKGGNPKRNSEYGISLLLSNVPMSPKIVNGSFAAMFEGDACKEIGEVTRHLSIGGEFLRPSPRRRGRLGEKDKQMSLDYSVLDRYRSEASRTMVAMGSLDSKIDEILEIGSSSAMRRRNNSESATGTTQTSVNGEGNTTEHGHASPNGHVKNGTGGGKKDGEQEGGRVLEQERWDTGHQVTNGGCASPAPAATPEKVTVTVKPAARVIEISKAVASKVKGVLMTFPTPPSPPTGGAADGTGNTPQYCKHCGHVLNTTNKEVGKINMVAKE